MSMHRVKTEKKDIFFLSFKGDSMVSTLDQITLPPAMGVNMGRSVNLYYSFGEWLKREGHGWEFVSEEKLCRLSIDYFNSSLDTGEKLRRFDRMAAKKDRA